MKKKLTTKNKIIMTAVAVAVCIAISVSAVYGWFLSGNRGEVGDVDLDVQGSVNVSLTATITDSNGEITGSFRFTDAVPGSRFTVTAQMTNHTTENRTVMLVISDLVEVVRPYFENDDGSFTVIENRRYSKITMRNAFAVVKDGGVTKYFSELPEMTQSGKDGKGLILFDDITVPARAPATEGSGTATIKFVIQFMNDVMGVSDTGVLEKITTDVLVDDDGANPSDSVSVDINAYQGQYFKIGTLEIVEKAFIE